MIPKKRKSARGDDSLGTSSTSVLLHNSIPSCQTRIAHGPLMQADSMTELSSEVQTNSPSDSEDDEENILQSDEEIVPVIQPYVPPQVDDLMSTMTIVPVVRRKSQDMAIVPGIQLHFWGFPENKAQRYGIEDMDRDVYSVIPVPNMDWNQEGSEFVSAMFQPFSAQGEIGGPISHPFDQKVNVSESQEFALTVGVFDETNKDQSGVCSILDDEQVSDLTDKMLASVRDIMESEGSEIQEIFKKKGSMDESEIEVQREGVDNGGKEDIYDAIFAGESGMDPEQQFIKEATAFIDEQGEPKTPKKCRCKKMGKDGKPLNKPCICKKGKQSTSILPDDLSTPVIEEKPLGEDEAVIAGGEEAPQEIDETETSGTSEEVPLQEEEEGIEVEEPTEKEEEITEELQDTGEAAVELEEDVQAEEEPPVAEEETTVEELPDSGEEEVESEEPIEEGEEAVALEEPLETGEETTVNELEEPQEVAEELSDMGEEAVQPEEGEESIEAEETAETEEEVIVEDAEEETAPGELSDTGEEAVEQEETEELVPGEALQEEEEAKIEPEELPDTGEDEVEVEQEEPPEEGEEAEISDNGEIAVEPEEPIEVEEETGEEAVEPEEPSETEGEPEGEEELSDTGEEVVEQEEVEELVPEETIEQDMESVGLPDTSEEEGEEQEPVEEGEEGAEAEELAESAEPEISDNGEEEVEAEEPIEVEEEELPETGEEAVESEEVPDEIGVIDDGIPDTEHVDEAVPVSKSRELIEELSKCACCCMKLLLAQRIPVTTQMPTPEELPCLAAQIAKESDIVPGDEATVEEETPEETFAEPSEHSASDLGEPTPDDIPESGEEMVSDIETVPDVEEVPISEGISDVTDESDVGEISELDEMMVSPEEDADGPLEQEDAPVESDVDEVSVIEAAEAPVEEEIPDSGEAEVEEVTDSGETALDEVTEGDLEETPISEEPPDSGEIEPEQALEEAPAPEDVPDTEETELEEAPDSGEIEPEQALEEAPAPEDVPDTEETELEEAPDSGEIEPEQALEEAPAPEDVPDTEETELEEAPDSGEAALDEVTEGVLDSEAPVLEEPSDSEEIESEHAVDEAPTSEDVPDSGETELEEVADDVIDSETPVWEIIVCVEDEAEVEEIAPETVITEEGVETEMPEGEDEEEAPQETLEAEESLEQGEETAVPADGEEGSPEEVIESGEDEIPSEIEEIPAEEVSKQGSDVEAGEEIDSTEEVMRDEPSGSATADKMASDGDEIIRRELSQLVTIVVSMEGVGREEIPGSGDQLLSKSRVRPCRDESMIGKELSTILDKLFGITAPAEDKQIILTDEQSIAREISILIDKAIATVEGVPLEFLRPAELVTVPKGTIIDINLVIKKRRHLQRKRIYTHFEFQEQKDVIEEEPEAPEGAIGDQPIAEETVQEEVEPTEPPKEEEGGPTEAEVVPPEIPCPEPCPEPPQEIPEETSNEKYRMKKFLAEFDIQMAPIKDRIRDLQKQVVDLNIPQFDRIIVLEPAFMRDPPAERPFEMPCKPCKKRPQPSKKNKRPFPPCCTQETACPQAASTNAATCCSSPLPPKYQPVPCSCSRSPMLEQNPAPRNQPGTPRPTKCQCSPPKPGCGQK